MSTTAKNGGDHTTENSDSGSFGRYREVPVEHLAPEMKAAYEFTLGMPGRLPGPSKIWLANPRLLQTITPTGAYFQTESIADRDCCDRFSSLDVVDDEVLP